MVKHRLNPYISIVTKGKYVMEAGLPFIQYKIGGNVVDQPLKLPDSDEEIIPESVERIILPSIWSKRETWYEFHGDNAVIADSNTFKTVGGVTNASLKDIVHGADLRIGYDILQKKGQGNMMVWLFYGVIALGILFVAWQWVLPLFMGDGGIISGAAETVAGPLSGAVMPPPPPPT